MIIFGPVMSVTWQSPLNLAASREPVACLTLGNLGLLPVQSMVAAALRLQDGVEVGFRKYL